MIFEPYNRHLLVERTPKDSSSFIALPDDYRTSDKYEKVKILSISSDVKSPLSPGQNIVVLSHMIEEVDFGHGAVYLILENHIVGILKETE
jgi:hypothetical protein